LLEKITYNHGDEACPAMLKKIKVPYARAEIKEWLSSLERDRKGVFKDDTSLI